MDFTSLALDAPLLLDSSQAWGPERILEEPSFIDTVPRNDEGFSLLSRFEQSYTSQESEFGLDDSPEFEVLLCGFAEQIESQRPALIEASQEAQLESFIEHPEHEDAEGETLISRSSQNKENDPATADITKGGDASSSRMLHLSWDCKSTEIDFSNYTVTSQARYKVRRTFQESKSRSAVNRAVAAVLGNETVNCTLGEVVSRMNKKFFQETGESVLSQPMGPFFSNTNFSAEFDDYAQQAARKYFFKESTEQDTVGCYLRDNEMDEDTTIKAILRAEIPKMLSDSNNEVNLLLKSRAEPFYLRQGTTYSRFQHEVQTLEEVHVLDYIKGTILGITEAYEQNFKAKFPDIFTDHDISDFFSEELEHYRMTARDPSRSKDARKVSHEIYKELLSFTKHRLEEIVNECGRMYQGSDFKSFQPQSKAGRELDKANKEKLFAIFQEIAPSTRSENPVLEDWGRSSGEPFGKWNLLKASALFRRCKGSKPMLPFIVACPQLCYLKASARGQPFRLVQEAVYLDMYTKRPRVNTQGIDAEASEVKEGGASGARGTQVIS
ncbi:hypothetical protein TWF706_005939 [Orbilia oligospora]|nr:hypothetical protein TWF706_005939 [Orbilia oligospora]